MAVTGGVAVVVLMVRVEVFVLSPLAKESELGLNEAVAPVGKELVRLRFAVNATVPVPRVTVTVYVALPAVP
jgi:hypothetical protein